jgi:cellulose synthase/poly-beta-1,6-N-acetylglucosamine synthase-like glycosyltransferase
MIERFFSDDLALPRTLSYLNQRTRWARMLIEMRAQDARRSDRVEVGRRPVP